jgi:putative selenate reductase
LGAQFSFSWSGDIDLEALKKEGYTSFVVATGAPVPRELPLAGSGIKVVDALEFLEAAHHAARSGKANPYDGAKAVVVAGGGNTAMDAARVACRLAGKPAVSILYRRTLAEMPADREEFEAALADGARYRELALPEAAAPAKGGALPTLTVRAMELGEPDASGRRAPIASARASELPCDLIVAAVGETPDRALFERLGARVGKDGRPVADPDTMLTELPGLYAAGDARRGPSSIISAEADGRKAAYAILRVAGMEPTVDRIQPGAPDYEALSRRGAYLPSVAIAAGVERGADPAFVRREAERCLSCGSACLRCVEVCPNRANMAIPVAAPAGGPYKQAIQILHVDDLCNECGNCGFFCPYEGEPYLGKPTLFSDEASLRASKNAGFAFMGDAASPSLLLRSAAGEAGGVEVLPFAEWTRTATAANAALIALARALRDGHGYLIPGGRA